MKRTKGTSETSYDDNDMIKIALEIFRTDAFLAINKKLIQKVGIIKAAYITNLVDKYKYFRDRGMLTEDGGFFLTYEEQTKQLGLSEHQLRTCKKEFIEAGVLRTEMRCVPRKEFYFIDFGELLSQFIVDEEDEPIDLIPDDSTNAKNVDESGDQFKQYSLKNLRNNAQKIQGIMLKNFKQYSSKNSSNIKKNLYKENEKENNILFSDLNLKESKQDKITRYIPLAEKLASIIRKNKRINVTSQKIASWANEIRKLIETDGVSIQRVETALDWYEDNIGGQYIPVIESGSSLRSKFIKLEDAMRRAGAVPGQSKTISADTPKDPKKVLHRFFRSKDLTNVFYRDCYESADELFEGTVDGGTLAETLLNLYSQIKEKQEQHLKGDLVRLLPGPMELIARYIDWIRDNTWITDIRLDMFDLNHSLFSRFRRDEAKTDNLERDAITGKSYMRG